MSGVKHLVENKAALPYEQLCKALIEQFAVKENVNWESLLPYAQQKELFGGEILNIVADHPKFTNQKDIRPISLMRGSISQLLFFFVRLNDEALTKAQIQKVTTRFIRGSEANRYIIWFFGNKNETELKVVLSGKEGKKVVLKTLSFGINQPYYKTYNFIFSEVQAKVNRLFVEPTDLWKTLWKAFDISIVNRNFYNEIKGAFEQLIAQLSRKGNPFKTDEDRVQFAIRLIGRIIFCWFLKRKEVLNDDALSLQAVKAHEKANYYQDLLEPLFFDVLNTPEKERKGGLPKTIARYPFLNGGLFEAQETDYQNNLQLSIDNKWFEDFFGNTLERYNFTVDENSSSNEEIAIDPEMLGRIFENLLAEQNPETGESARKATGSFYTPREIVDYMVEQSITEYLKTALSSLSLGEGWGEAIEDFVHTNHLPEQTSSKHFNNQTIEQLNLALAKIKVLDPACGSGAFPIGVLQKVVALKRELWQAANPKKQFSNSAIYQLKLNTIQNSIYGVDIQPMAVELSRLRCWLSLVVDEEPTDIKALPNLDFKFVCADSLVDVPVADYVTDDLERNLKELEDNVEQYFSPDFRSKKKIQTAIKSNISAISKFHHNIIAQLVNKIRKEEKNASPAKLKQLREKMLEYFQMDAKWNTYENIFRNRKVDFFNPVFFFPSAKKGFDIIIGNPPYVSGKSGLLSDEQKEYYNANYETAEYQLDTYILFTERATRVAANSGVVTFIMPNTWMANLKLTKIRKYLLEKTEVQKIVTMPSDVFLSAVVDTVILVCKVKVPNDYQIEIGTFKEWQYSKLRDVDYNQFYTNDKFVFEISVNEQSKILIGQIESGTQKVSSICDVNRGVHAYRKDGYGKSKFTKGYQTERDYNERSYHSKTKLDKTYFKEVRGKNVFPYYYELSDDYVSYGDWLAEPREWKYFTGERIYLRKIVGNTLYASLANTDNIADQSVYIAKPKKGQTILTRYLLAVLNSRLITWYFRVKANEFDDLFPQIKITEFKELPIKITSIAIQEVIASLVSFTILSKCEKKQIAVYVSNEQLAKQLEEVIDACVLELYFGEEMKNKQIDVLALVEKELNQTLGSADFEKLPVEAKAEAINKFYSSVSHPDSAIRNRILKFPIASPDILKPILQG